MTRIQNVYRPLEIHEVKRNGSMAVWSRFCFFGSWISFHNWPRLYDRVAVSSEVRIDAVLSATFVARVTDMAATTVMMSSIVVTFREVWRIWWTGEKRFLCFVWGKTTEIYGITIKYGNCAWSAVGAPKVKRPIRNGGGSAKLNEGGERFLKIIFVLHLACGKTRMREFWGSPG